LSLTDAALRNQFNPERIIQQVSARVNYSYVLYKT